ncbi:hypothetical protein PR001_g23190 [Phytophthora rubi]|nr:hypothetical protein PR001_g23190 [Phytophthora rubi]
MLHDRFGKRALVDMLVSATYWQALDRIPWMNFVPEGYYHAAQEKLEDPAMTEVPELWEPLPIKPTPGSPDSSLSWLHSSDGDEDDDKFDKTYQGKDTASSGPVSARSQSGASGKRPRGSGSVSRGSATKVAKTSTQSSAGSTSRPKAKLPAPLPDDVPTILDVVITLPDPEVAADKPLELAERALDVVGALVELPMSEDAAP